MFDLLMKHAIYYFLLIILLLTSSCVIHKPTSQQVSKQIIIVSPDKTACDSDKLNKECYQVKWTENQGNWELLNYDIEGFTFDPGYLYKLLVSVEPNSTLVSDNASLKYKLIRVLKKEAVCKNPITKSEVLSLLKEKGLLLYPKGISNSEIAETPSYQPKATFDLTTCIWTISSSKYDSVTYEGECANTNGCTPEIRLTVQVNAQTSEIFDQKEERILHPNYE